MYAENNELTLGVVPDSTTILKGIKTAKTHAIHTVVYCLRSWLSTFT